MLISRRCFLGSAAGACVMAGALGSPAFASRPRRLESTWFTWSKLADGVHAGMGEGGNTLLIVAKGECVLVDSKNTGYGAALRREAEALAGVSCKTLINTHHHFDHTGGNSAFTSDASVLAHAKAIARIDGNIARYKAAPASTMAALGKSEKPGAKAIMEDVKALQKQLDGATTDKAVVALFAPKSALVLPGSATVPDKKTIGGVEIELYHVGAGHTDNDVFIRLPKLNVIHTGDLLFNKVWPYMDRAGGCDTLGWIDSLKAMLALCDDKTVVLPGHGEKTNKAGVQTQIHFFDDMRAVAIKAVAAGTTREEFLRINPDMYKDYAPGIRQVTLGGLWDEAKGVPVEKK